MISLKNLMVSACTCTVYLIDQVLPFLDELGANGAFDNLHHFLLVAHVHFGAVHMNGMTIAIYPLEHPLIINGVVLARQ